MVGSSVLAVKTHSGVRHFQAAIHIVRSPDKAIVSEWNRHAGHQTQASEGGRHIAVASPEQFGMFITTAYFNIFLQIVCASYVVHVTLYYYVSRKQFCIETLQAV